MDWLKLIIFIVGFIIVTLLFTLWQPPEIEDKSSRCVINSDGICEYDKDLNWAFIGGIFLIALVFIMIAIIEIASHEDNAYIMSLPEALSKYSQENKLMTKLPPPNNIVPLRMKDLDGGKRMMIWFRNPFDYHKIHIHHITMMSDYATTNSETKKKDPLIAWTNEPLSIQSAMSILRSKDRDLVSQIVSLDKTLERKGYNDTALEVIKDNVEREQERRDLPGVIK